MSELKLTVEQKFARAMLQLRTLRPFYSAVYEVMEKRKSDIVSTMGVTTNELLYNEGFVDELSFEQFLFVVLHEIGHIALKHCVRLGERDPQIWNLACDLYVNKVLSEEFNIEPSKSMTSGSIKVEMPEGLCFCSSVDTRLDYTEKIYDSMMEQLEEQKRTNPGKETYQIIYKGSGNCDVNSKYGIFKININSIPAGDLINNGKDAAAQQQEADKIVADAVTRSEMNGIGNSPGNLYTCVKARLKSVIDWRKILRRYLIQATSKVSSFKLPDKRMYYQKAIYPGNSDSDELKLERVKVCIDTSGSVSDEDLMYFFGQIDKLLREYKVKAELIYWDATIQSTGEFSNFKELERVKLTGRGGTDPSVVFNYFDSKKCKIKPIVTLMFTDAYFSTDDITPKQRKKYKDTIWILTKNGDSNFKAPFGKVAPVRY